MGRFRFFRRIKVAPGVTLNLSKRGVSASFGPRGAKATIGTSGRRYSVGLPGTGLFWREDVTYRKGGSSGQNRSKPGDMSTSDADTVAAYLRPGFFEKIFMSDIEKTLREALAHVLQQKYFEAVMLLLDYPHEPDCCSRSTSRRSCCFLIIPTNRIWPSFWDIVISGGVK